jgi:hypothetical protein
MLRFEWKCSYLDQREYRVHGETPVKSIECYSALECTLEYFKSIFNFNGDPTAFEREVLSRQGGVAITYSEDRQWPRRWPRELYEAFVEHLKEKHAASLVECERIWAKHSDVPHEPHPPLFIPRPIYYSTITRRYETEEWYQEAAVTAA